MGRIIFDGVSHKATSTLGMFESEINRKREPISQIPQEVLEQFTKDDGCVSARTVLPWSEHCTECVWPTCYTTCDLYAPREDGKCRRFIDGMVRIDHPEGLNAYLLKIRFKQWGKLWTSGNTRPYSLKQARQLERKDQIMGVLIRNAPVPSGLKSQVINKQYARKKRWATAKPTDNSDLDDFLLECYNPQQETVSMTFTLRPQGQRSNLPYQQSLDIAPGFNRVRIPLRAITERVNITEPFTVELTPNEVIHGTTLYFGFMDFVKDSRSQRPSQHLCKCVVWDLDNTLWDGTLVEDQRDGLSLKPGVKAVISELDRRGILQSIASKNDHAEAMEVLKQFELDHYFLYPQISWSPKSRALKHIAQSLNIGLNTLLFIDDQPFERQEVRKHAPEVTVVDAAAYRELPDRPECQAPVTAESARRRLMYQEQQQRHAILEAFDGPYFDFLKECKINVFIRPMRPENLERVHELTQRTNQMNFSGNRYDHSRLRQLLKADHLDTYVIQCEDTFGNYGTVGFCVVDRRQPLLLDLMFSCRIQSKRVEHAVLAFLLGRYRKHDPKDFYATYKKTVRNAPSGKVFDDMGFEDLGEEDGVSRLRFKKDKDIPNDAIIDVTYSEDSSP